MGAAVLPNVSRETEEKFRQLAELVRSWQAVRNLVAPSTINEIWERHILDSAQLFDLAPQEGDWIDLGSGSGFPGLVVAAMMGPGRTMHLIESDKRKCAFLQYAATQLDLPVRVHVGRIEKILLGIDAPVATISARAVARLDQLLAWTSPLIQRGVVGIFPKGQDVEIELQTCARYGELRFRQVASQTDCRGRIVIVEKNSPAPSPTGE